jgi:hypothetical protein
MRPARIGHRFEQVGKAMQGGFGQQDLGLLTTSGREDTLACDTIYGRLTLRKDLDCYRYLISREKPLSAIIHKPWSTSSDRCQRGETNRRGQQEERRSYTTLCFGSLIKHLSHIGDRSIVSFLGIR